MKDIDNYKKDTAVSAIALKKFLVHLWYLSEELAAFGFFKNEITVETKCKLLDTPEDEHSLEQVNVDAKLIQDEQLENFVS